jgi:hypothetical protein
MWNPFWPLIYPGYSFLNKFCPGICGLILDPYRDSGGSGKEDKGEKKVRDVETKAVALNPESLDFSTRVFFIKSIPTLDSVHSLAVV